MLQLQGELDTKGVSIQAGQHLGTIGVDDKGNPMIVVGSHVMSGARVALKKPLAVLKTVHHDPHNEQPDTGSGVVLADGELKVRLTLLTFVFQAPNPFYVNECVNVYVYVSLRVLSLTVSLRRVS